MVFSIFLVVFFQHFHFSVFSIFIWCVQTILLSDSSSEDESEDRPCTHEDLQAMLKIHKHQKRHQSRFYQNPQLRKYMYYSSGLLSNYDKYPEHHKSIVGPKKKSSKEQKKIEKKVKGKGVCESMGVLKVGGVCKLVTLCVIHLRLGVYYG